MKVVLTILLVVSVSANGLWHYLQTPEQDMIKGMFAGIGEKGDSGKFLQCLGELNEVKKLMEQAIEHILKLTYEDVAKGVRLMIQAMQLIFEETGKCAKDFPKVKKLLENLKNFDGMSIVKKLILQSGTITNHATQAFNFFVRKDYFNCGRQNGAILKIFFLESFSGSDDDRESKFIAGLLKGIGEQKSPVDLMKCLDNLDPYIQKIKEGLHVMKGGTFANITTGVKMILEAVRDMLKKGSPCFDDYEVVQRLFDKIRLSTFNEVARKVINNMGRLILDIDFAINGFINNDFESAGKGLGDILKFIYLS